LSVFPWAPVRSTKAAIKLICLSNIPQDDETIVQFTNSTESRSSVASRGYSISDSLTMFERIPLDQLLSNIGTEDIQSLDANQLHLFQ
jgi:hypothetical protein